MNLFGPKRLWRGVHVPAHKEQTAHLPIRRLPFPPLLVVPLSQHAGKPAKAIVREGQEVVRGEPIAEADFVRANIAPTEFKDRFKRLLQRVQAERDEEATA